MPREYGKVQTRFWANSDVQSLSDRGKLLSVYLLTGPHSNALGCFRLPVPYIIADLRWPAAAASKIIRELEGIEFLRYDHKSAWAFLCRFLAWNRVENPNQGKNVESLFDLVPRNVVFYHDLVASLLENTSYLSEHLRNRLETLSKAFRNQEQEQEQEQEPEMEGSSERFAMQSSSPAPLPFVTLTLNDKREHPVFPDQVRQLGELFPAVDVEQELREMKAWCIANPSRRKTARGIEAFIQRWLSKEQDAARNGSPQSDAVRQFLERTSDEDV